MDLNGVKGFTEKRIDDLNKMNIYTLEDLVRCYPRKYLDLTKQVLLSECYNNDIVLTLARISGMPQLMFASKSRKYVKAYIEQEGRLYEAIWFNQPYVISKLKSGEQFLFYGRVQNRYGTVSIVNPSFEMLDKNYNLKGIVPVYSVKGNMTQKVMRYLVSVALSLACPVSVIPEKFIRKNNLISLERAYFEVHKPRGITEKQQASERVALEEYFILISAFKLIKGSREQVRLNKYTCSSNDLLQFISKFPYEFTDGQKKAINEIYSDLSSANVMNRLLQGDVGCGKTAVGLCAIFMAYKSGYQSAMIAPTEVLARQNFKIVCKYFPENDVTFLSGSITVSEKKKIKERIKSGEIKIVVGTHAVLTSDVEFLNLSLCICDEQQRFGVAQRSSLIEKGSVPDVLAMSATPIPRTLSLIFYGDLDITTIADKPVSRAKIGTFLIPDNKYEDMLKFISGQIVDGRQAYFVCPLIDGDEEGATLSATELYDDLKSKLPEIRFGLLHGRMREKQKNEVMSDFRDHLIDCIVSTTVIEVGVDVPNATVMVIMGAERFGLSQLHQLRGRVGRGEYESFCFLIATTDKEESLNRLDVLKKNSDGFKISEADFETRGSGDFLGTRQSGKFFGELGGLSFPSSVIFFAKKLSDDVFLSGEDIEPIKRYAFEKYEKLKDVTLN